jgi:uncharacterized DUF497 family protein
MKYLRILWDDPADPDGNVQHIEEHGLSIDDIEHVLDRPSSTGTSRSSGNACVWGTTSDDKYIIIVYEEIDDDTIRVITAYEAPEPR